MWSPSAWPFSARSPSASPRAVHANRYVRAPAADSEHPQPRSTRGGSHGGIARGIMDPWTLLVGLEAKLPLRGSGGCRDTAVQCRPCPSLLRLTIKRLVEPTSSGRPFRDEASPSPPSPPVSAKLPCAPRMLVYAAFARDHRPHGAFRALVWVCSGLVREYCLGMDSGSCMLEG